MEDLEENFLSPFQIVKRIDEQAEIENLEYSINGESFSYTTNGSLKIHSAITGTLKNIINVKIDAMKYFQNSTLLHSKDSMIYYLSVYDNKYLRKFEGHSDRIFNLSVNSFADIFMSVGNQSTHIWDIRSRNPIFRIDSKGKMGAMSADQEYALADNNFVYIFDRRNDKGPLAIKSIKSNFYKSMGYTGDSSCIAVSADREHVFLDNSGDSISSCVLESSSVGDIANESNILICSSSKFIFAYKISDKKRIGRLETGEYEYKALKTNPAHSQFISASKDSLEIWNFAEKKF